MMDIVLANNRYDEEISVMTLKSDGSVSIAGTLTTRSNLTVNGYTILGNNVWNRSVDGIYRTYYGTNDISYYCARDSPTSHPACGGPSRPGPSEPDRLHPARAL